MKDWLQKEISSINYALTIDTHCLFEHVTSSGTLLKNSLETLQKLCKLETHSVNHAISIASFENKYPKFFNKTAENMVATSEGSLFDTVKLWDEWNDPNYGYRVHLQEETLVAQKAIEATISEDRALSETGRSLVLNCLISSVSFMDGLINYINTTHRELTMSRYFHKKAWHLVTSLTRRILEKV